MVSGRGVRPGVEYFMAFQWSAFCTDCPKILGQAGTFKSLALKALPNSFTFLQSGDLFSKYGSLTLINLSLE